MWAVEVESLLDFISKMTGGGAVSFLGDLFAYIEKKTIYCRRILRIIYDGVSCVFLIFRLKKCLLKIAVKMTSQILEKTYVNSTTGETCQFFY